MTEAGPLDGFRKVHQGSFVSGHSATGVICGTIASVAPLPYPLSGIFFLNTLFQGFSPGGIGR